RLTLWYQFFPYTTLFRSLELPEDVYERVRRAAKGMNQPVEKALVNIVRAATPSLEKVPPEYRAELEAMEDLGDEDLWRILRSRPDRKSTRLNSSHGSISY